MNETPVSVIIPIYNAGAYLAPCLDSVLGQTHRALDVICLNDGSTDGSLEVLRAYEQRDGRVRVVDKPNEGYGATCNRGLALARGEWIAIVEPDDWIEPQMYADMLAFAAKFDAAEEPLDIVKTPYWRVVSDGRGDERKVNCSYRGRINPPRQPFSIADAAHLLTHHPSIWSAMYRASFLRDKGIRFKEIPGAGWADNPFLVETLCQTSRIGYFDVPYYCYREDTPEKAKSFAEANHTLPFERWNDMMDVLERLGVDDERILRAHYSRGFTYLSGVIAHVDLTHDDVRAAAKAMFKRMDPRIVFSDPGLAPDMKRLFAGLRGIPCPQIDPIPYLKRLADESVYYVKNAGLRATARTAAEYVRNHF